ncbi:allatostatin-A receptor-like [Ptychodera flava]|uniref:allatostatin-A receptor-like n=1 Tax=Ptychodera flava TaxID=63121 RepID=UPI00396AA015
MTYVSTERTGTLPQGDEPEGNLSQTTLGSATAMLVTNLSQAFLGEAHRIQLNTLMTTEAPTSSTFNNSDEMEQGTNKPSDLPLVTSRSTKSTVAVSAATSVSDIFSSAFVNSMDTTLNYLSTLPPQNVSTPSFDEDMVTNISNEVDATGPSFRFEIPYLLTVCLIGFIGNILVLLVYSKEKFRKSNAVLYVISLAVGDIMILLVVVFHVTEFFPELWIYFWQYDWSCGVHRYFRFFGFNVTVFTMVAIAFDRYFAICHPIRFKTSFTLRRTGICIICLWVLGALTAVPTAFMFKTKHGSSSMGITYRGKIPFACKLVVPVDPWFLDFKAIYLNVVLFYLPSLLISIVYIIIVFRVWMSARNPLGRLSSKEFKSKHWKTARILITVFVAYFMSFVLFSTYNLISRYWPGTLPSLLKNAGLLLPYFNSCVNPIIYSFMFRKFREACREIICCSAWSTRGRNSVSREMSSESKPCVPNALSESLYSLHLRGLGLDLEAERSVTKTLP